jgi:hypothetical protein
MEFLGFRRAQFPGGTPRMKAGLPENFVGHPIANPRKTSLQKQHGLDRSGAMAAEECFHDGKGKLPGEQGRRQTPPPRRRGAPAVKKHAAELARIAENKTSFGEAQDQVVVPGRSERDGAGQDGPEFARHAEVNSHPGVVGKAKEHLFAAGLRMQEPGAGESLPQDFRVDRAKNSVRGVKMDGGNCLSSSHVPLFAKVFQFGQLGHE